MAAQIEGVPQVSESGNDGAWNEGETVEVRVTFTEAVDVGTSRGTPTIALALSGTAARQAAYTSGSGTEALVFSYTLATGDGAHQSMFVTPDSLQLNGGTITTTAGGADADLVHNGTGVIAGPALRSDDPFVASFTELPEHHDGESHSR